MTAYAGTGALARLAVRRDRIRLPVWVYGVTALAASTAFSLRSLYPHGVGLAVFGASLRGNATFTAMYGPVYSATTLGGLSAWRAGLVGAVFASVMSILTVIRHTRAEEEAGRTELVGAAAIGRRAPLTAALGVMAGANVTLATLVALVVAASGAGVTGAIAMGAAMAAAGLAFGGVAAVAAQLTDGARAGTGIAIAVLGGAYLLRAVGDTAGVPVLSWISPLGWSTLVRPYASERWWVLALPLALGALLVAVAYLLVARRDVGSGLFPARLGRPTAAPSLRTPLALAVRQQRGLLIGWAAGFLAFGAALGSASKGVANLINSSPQLKDIIARLGGGAALVDAYFATVFGLMGLIASAYAITAVLRARTEETDMRAEQVLATGASRLAYAGSHLAVALVGSALLLIVAGAGAGFAYGVTVHDIGGQMPRMIGAALAQWPAVAVLAGFTTLLYGVAPRATPLAWGLYGALVLLGQVGPLLKLGQAVMDVSPYTHVPKLPGHAAAATPLIALAAVAAVLITAGLAGFRRRDIGTG